jgi:uncharacterized membrane protein
VIERILRIAVALLALAGAAIASYLTYTHFQGWPPVCMTGRGCEIVQRSQWSKLLGIPVALLGAITYLVIVASTIVRHPLSKLAGATISLGALGFNIYLFYIQAERIHAYCSWCVTNEIVSLVLAPIAIAWVLVSSGFPPAKVRDSPERSSTEPEKSATA